MTQIITDVSAAGKVNAGRPIVCQNEPTAPASRVEKRAPTKARKVVRHVSLKNMPAILIATRVEL